MTAPATLDRVVREHVLAALARHGWRPVAAAAELGVAVKTVYNHLARYEGQGFVTRDRAAGVWRIHSCEADAREAAAASDIEAEASR